MCSFLPANPPSDPDCRLDRKMTNLQPKAKKKKKRRFLTQTLPALGGFASCQPTNQPQDAGPIAFISGCTLSCAWQEQRKPLYLKSRWCPILYLDAGGSVGSKETWSVSMVTTESETIEGKWRRYRKQPEGAGQYRAFIGCQRSVNIGDVRQPRWRKGKKKTVLWGRRRGGGGEREKVAGGLGEK